LAPGYVEDPHQFVQIGDLVQVWVVSVDRDKKRISLSAIPPGQEAPSKPTRGANEGERRGGGGRGPTGGGGNRGGRAPNQGGENRGNENRGGDNRGGRPGRDGGRDSGNRGGGFRGDSGRGGQQGRGRGFGGRNKRHEENTRDEEATVVTPKPVVERPSKSAPILTEAMQKGREPLRSFADLMQFYQTQKDPSSPASPTEATSKNNEPTNPNTDSTDV